MLVSSKLIDRSIPQAWCVVNLKLKFVWDWNFSKLLVLIFSNLQNWPLQFRTADYRSNFRKNTDKYGHLATTVVCQRCLHVVCTQQSVKYQEKSRKEIRECVYEKRERERGGGGGREREGEISLTRQGDTGLTSDSLMAPVYWRLSSAWPLSW